MSLDTLTWTWKQAYGAFGCFWLTMCQFSSQFEAEFLPVYTPNREERDDPKLYASNVRTRMAVRLGLPTVEKDFSEFLNGSSAKLDSQIENDPEIPPTSIVDFVGNLTHI